MLSAYLTAILVPLCSETGGYARHIPFFLFHVYSALCRNLSWPVSCCSPIKIPLNYITLCLINLMDAPSLIPQGGREKNRERVNESQCSLLSGCGCLRESHFNLENHCALNFFFFAFSNCFYVDIQHRGRCLPSESGRKWRRSQSRLEIRRIDGKDFFWQLGPDANEWRSTPSVLRVIGKCSNVDQPVLPFPLTSGFSSSALVTVKQ